MKRAVMCIVRNQGHAEIVVARLQGAGIPNKDISVVFPDERGTAAFAGEHRTNAPEGAAAGMTTGGLLGGSLGLLAGIGAIAIPGIGPIIAAGPLVATLSGLAAGAAVGGVTGALVGLGIPEPEARRVEGRLRAGGILVSVHTESADQRILAEEIFETGGAEDILSTPESGSTGTLETRTRA